MNYYQNPLNTRYASEEMKTLYSPQKKHSTWRRLWVALAQAEHELGLSVTEEQVELLRKHVDNIDFEAAARHEKRTRHDVMAHVHAYGDVCPEAMPIIHLGATSAYVGDNTDLILLRDACDIIEKKLVILLSRLSKFAVEYKSLPTLGFTHFQPAQLTTVGKRATLWMIDLLMDYDDLCYIKEQIKFRGVKGTTGTQASFLKLFDGDHEKVEALDRRVTSLMGFEKRLAVTGQTYSRKIDSRVLQVLSSIAQSLHKMTNDIRLLQNLKEIEEPFAKGQIGSSAMAYKRNPMRSERISSLCKFIISSSLNPALVQSTQWFERTLDDSANRRLSVPESMMATDACLDIAINIASDMVVYPKMIERHVLQELPFMATENVIMEAVKRGGDRQELHEVIRVHSMDAGRMVKVEGQDNDLIERMANDDNIPLTLEEIQALVDPSKFIGRSPQQVDTFINEEVRPVIEKYEGVEDYDISLNV